MSQDRNRRGGKAKGNRRPNKRGGAQKPAAVSQDPNRPFWTSPTDATALERGIGLVRPSQDPTALVRSLGSPPLGRFADNAQHYYAAVYEKAQRFAVAMATANGVLVDDGEDAAGDTDGPAGTGG